MYMTPHKPASTGATNKRELHKNPHKAVVEFMEHTKTLGDLLEIENTALKSRDFVSFAHMQAAKARLCEDYAQMVKQIETRRSEFEALDRKVSKGLSKENARLGELLKNNALTLERMGSSVGRICERILNKARGVVQRHQATSYGASGLLGNASERLSVSLNDTA